MAKHAWTVVCLLVTSLAWPGQALPQTASPEAVAAAREFVVAAKMVDQLKQMMTIMFQQLRPPSMQNNPAGDSIAAAVVNVMNSHLDAYVNEVALIYARHFTADEIRELTAFYRTPAAEKLLQRQPELARDIAIYLQKLSPSLTAEIKKVVDEELRKSGQRP